MSFKKASISLLVALFILVPVASVLAYGPDRTTYTCNSAGQCIGADHVQFNSFVNNPAYGDERDFLMIRDASSATSTYADSIQLTAGHSYVVRFYVHNNAQQDLSGITNYVAHDTTVRVGLPTQVNGSALSTGYISASNANPGTVFDDVTLTSSGALNLSYVTGSARILTNGINATLSDSIVSSGAPVGYSALNGEWPGCFQYSGWVTLTVQATAVPPTPVTPVTPPVVASTSTPAKTLPNTGPGDVGALFVGTSAFGGIGHYIVSRRRRN